MKYSRNDWFSLMPGGSTNPSLVAVGLTCFAGLYMISFNANYKKAEAVTGASAGQHSTGRANSSTRTCTSERLISSTTSLSSYSTSRAYTSGIHFSRRERGLGLAGASSSPSSSEAVSPRMVDGVT
jgi:hypothetical protein